jgi:TPP-dependent pyruvate/acetoin dehydrogenase alpha subunit
MLLSRTFEERAAEEYSKGNIIGFLHLYPGEEAVAAGVINAAGPSDYIVSTYREHAHALVRGTPAREVMAEGPSFVFLAKPRSCDASKSPRNGIGAAMTNLHCSPC